MIGKIEKEQNITYCELYLSDISARNTNLQRPSRLVLSVNFSDFPRSICLLDLSEPPDEQMAMVDDYTNE